MSSKRSEARRKAELKHRKKVAQARGTSGAPRGTSCQHTGIPELDSIQGGPNATAEDRRKYITALMDVLGYTKEELEKQAKQFKNKDDLLKKLCAELKQ